MARPRSLRCLRRAVVRALRLGTLVALAALASQAAAADTLEPPRGYRLVWADEFDRDGPPDPARWVHDTGRNREGWHNDEKQYYAGPAMDNARVEGGRLRITARREAPTAAPDWGGQRYTSARLITRGRAEWTYGFFEVRAKLPCGAGTWSAIWTLFGSGQWPDDGELDIMEHVGRMPGRTMSAVHVAAGHAGRAIAGLAPVPTACSAFHRYQMHWTADGVTFGVDGMPHLQYPKLDVGRRAWPFDAPQFLILNVAIGGHLGGAIDDAIFPVTMEIDYVRVFQHADAAGRPDGDARR